MPSARNYSNAELTDEAFYREAKKPFVAEDWDRNLVCEGRCNPHIHDYDNLVKRVGAGGNRGKYTPWVLADMVKTLVHTRHNTLDNNLRYDSSRESWGRLWKCTVCGHSRIA